MKTSAKISISSLFLALAFISCESEDYSPFLEVVNNSGTYHVTEVYVDSGPNLVSGDPIYPDEFRDFPMTVGNHDIDLVYAGHDDSPLSYNTDFFYGYFLEIDIWSEYTFFTDYYHEEYWGLD